MLHLCLAFSAVIHMTLDPKCLAPALSHPAAKQIFVPCCAMLLTALAHDAA